MLFLQFSERSRELILLFSRTKNYSRIKATVKLFRTPPTGHFKWKHILNHKSLHGYFKQKHLSKKITA